MREKKYKSIMKLYPSLKLEFKMREIDKSDGSEDRKEVGSRERESNSATQHNNAFDNLHDRTSIL